jgi:hypothetical protein
VKLAPLRCPACGRERNVLERERGHTVACDACGTSIEVPASLAFPDYAELHRDRMLAINLEMAIGLSCLFCCLPASAMCWWIASGAIQREKDAERPVDPMLARARRIARILTVAQLVAWCIVGHKAI